MGLSVDPTGAGCPIGLPHFTVLVLRGWLPWCPQLANWLQLFPRELGA